jgi:hypothetical protein
VIGGVRSDLRKLRVTSYIQERIRKVYLDILRKEIFLQNIIAVACIRILYLHNLSQTGHYFVFSFAAFNLSHGFKLRAKIGE